MQTLLIYLQWTLTSTLLSWSMMERIHDSFTAGLEISFTWSFISHLSKPVLFWSWLSSSLFCPLQHHVSAQGVRLLMQTPQAASEEL